MPEAKKCIFCQNLHTDETVEHIVPRTLGNLHYILAKGSVCGKCNSKFSKFENQVVSSPYFLKERKKLGLLRKSYKRQQTELTQGVLQKFLLKMAYEALYKSRRKIWDQTDFSCLLEQLFMGKEHEIFSDKPGDKQLNYHSIPGWWNRFILKNNQIKLEYADEAGKLFFRFQFGRISSEIRVA